jgi:hypothetical protein
VTTGLTYSDYVTQIATMAVVPSTDTNFQTILPQMISYAENRIYRDLDFLFTSIATTAYSCTVGSRSIQVPQGTFVVSEQINVITPHTVTNPDLGTRNPLLPVTKEFLDAVYNVAGSKGIPQYFAPFDDYNFLLGPYPDQAYTVEIVGTYRPASLSATNTTTFISLYLPDLMIMASMVYISAYQRNFLGASANDPNMPVTYESQYQTLLKGAMVEEARKKFEASGWTSQSPSPVATPSRG